MRAAKGRLAVEHVTLNLTAVSLSPILDGEPA